MLQVGDRLPDLTLPAGTREGRTRIRVADELAKGPLVLAFYPLAFTGTCTEQVCDLRDALQDLASLGARVLGFSIDSAAANAAFAKAEDLPFPLLSDPNREVVGSIWQTQRVSGVEACAKRGIVLVGQDGVVRWVWITDDAGEWIGVDAVRNALASA